MPRVRVRQHVNPLSKRYQTPLNPPSWETLYSDLTRPFFLDIGSARGRFLLEMAKIKPEYNFLGVEIREPLVEEANAKRDELGLTNVYYLFCHVNNSLGILLGSLPPNSLNYVTIQFPDPWFKKRHAKRRIVQPQLVNTLADYLNPHHDHADFQGSVFLQSDVASISEEIASQFDAHPAFVREQPPWLPENPLPVATEREVTSLKENKPIYRTLFHKKA